LRTIPLHFGGGRGWLKVPNFQAIAGQARNDRLFFLVAQQTRENLRQKGGIARNDKMNYLKYP